MKQSNAGIKEFVESDLDFLVESTNCDSNHSSMSHNQMTQNSPNDPTTTYPFSFGQEAFTDGLNIDEDTRHSTGSFQEQFYYESYYMSHII